MEEIRTLCRTLKIFGSRSLWQIPFRLHRRTQVQQVTQTAKRKTFRFAVTPLRGTVNCFIPLRMPTQGDRGESFHKKPAPPRDSFCAPQPRSFGTVSTPLEKTSLILDCVSTQRTKSQQLDIDSCHSAAHVQADASANAPPFPARASCLLNRECTKPGPSSFGRTGLVS